MKLITDLAGVVHAMARAEERAQLHRTSAVFCRLQMTRYELFNPKSNIWTDNTRAYFGELAGELEQRAEACQGFLLWGLR